METIRRVVQILFTILTNAYVLFPVTKTIYRGPLKVLCSPGLNCYSCPAATTYCPIGSLQQLLLGIRLSLDSGLFYVGSYVVGTMGIIGAVTGRFTCGWLCPFGFFQELLYKIPFKKTRVPGLLKYVKYLFLLFLVILFPLFLINDASLMGEPYYCKYICPAGTLEAGLPMILLQPDLKENLGYLFLNKLTLLILFLIWCMSANRAFCKTACPLGAFYGLFNRVSLVKLQLNSDNCTDCGACKDVCPMDIQFNKNPGSSECIQCLKCMTVACKFNAITVECAGVPLQSVIKPMQKKVEVEGREI